MSQENKVTPVPRKSFARRLLLSHGYLAAAAVLLASLALGVILYLENVMAKVSHEDFPVTESSVALVNGLHQSVENLQRWVFLGDEESKQENIVLWRETILPSLQEFISLSETEDHFEREQSRNLSELLKKLHAEEWWVMELANTPGDNPSQFLIDREIAPLAKKNLLPALSLLIRLQGEKEATKSGEELLEHFADLRYNFTALFHALQTKIATGDAKADEDFSTYWMKLNQTLASVPLIELNLQQHTLFTDLRKDFTHFWNLSMRAVQAYRNNGHFRSHNLLRTNVFPLERLISKKVLEISTHARNEMRRNIKITTDFANRALLILAFLWVFFLLFTFWFTRKSIEESLRPLKRLREATQRFAEGEFNEILPVETDDEIGALSSAFNEMREKVTAGAELLRLSLAQHEAFIETAHDGIVTFGLDGIIQSFNPAAEKIFGYSAVEAVGRNVEILAPEEFNISEQRVYFKNLLRKEERGALNASRIEICGLRKDGSRVPVEISIGVVFLDPDPLITAVFTDISERKELENDLKESFDNLEERVKQRTEQLEEANSRLQEEIRERKEAEEKLMLASRVFENSMEGIMVTTLSGQIISVNPAVTVITGYKKEELLGQKPSILRSNHHDEGFYKNMWGKLLKEGMWQGEIWNRRKDGDVYPEWLTISSVRDYKGNIINFVAVFFDISERKEIEQKMKHQAYHDALTGLPNRKLFEDRLELSINHAERGHKMLALMFIDLDNFKNVNDSLGHLYGDILLQQVSERLKECLREEDTVARIGGDEFTIIIGEMKSENAVIAVAEKIISTLSRPFQLRKHEAFIGASIGITIYPHDGTESHVLVKNADLAMYKAKESGKNKFHLFSKSLNEKVNQRVKLEHHLRKAVANREFVLYYQPKVGTGDHKIRGVEALLRWQSPHAKTVNTGELIEVAEECGLIIPLGEWVLDTACREMRRLYRDLGKMPGLAVNISGIQFNQKGLVDLVRSTLELHDFPARKLVLEITEGAVMKDVHYAIQTMKELRGIGVKFSIDDFGTGYSSLSSLKQFPVESLKIDRSFVKDIPEDAGDMAIAEATISLAHSLGLHVVAEGVETKEQLEFLHEKGCEQIQGYYFSRPLPMEELYAYIEKEDSVTDVASPAEPEKL